MQSKVQILGLSEYYPAVLFDILKDLGFKEFEFFPNMESSLEPYLPIKKNKYQVRNPGDILDKDLIIIFGVSGPKNKIPVFEYFRENQALNVDDISTFIHKSSYSSVSCEIGKGVFIEQNCTISSQTSLGNCVSVKRGVTIGHHSIISDWVDVNPGVTISGRVNIGEATVIGSGATIIDGVSIGENSLIGAGSVVTKDIPSGVIAFGNPCKIIKENKNWNFKN